MANFNQSFVQFTGANLGNIGAGKKTQLLIARVTHVVQGPFLFGTNIPDKYYSDPTNLGEITYQLISSTQRSTLDSGNQTAKPIFAGIKQYPLEGEFVYLLAGPSIRMNESREQVDFFYLPPFNIWGASHHNAFPDLGDYGAFADEIKRTYQGSIVAQQPVNVSATGSLTFPLGPNFVEKPNIRSLRQFTGDVTVEGRWGNSIRLGSTSLPAGNGPVVENSWSNDSEPGNPITIIRNGQGRTVDNLGWFPTVENINTDPSSIYLTQGQKIVIDDINRNFSLASLQVALETTNTVAIPIQQQLTSTEATSPRDQDIFVSDTSQQPSQTQPTGPITTNTSTSAVRVVGDYQDLSSIDGTYVVSLRVVDTSGNILSSASGVQNTALGAYNSATADLKSKNPNIPLTIPTLATLIN